MASIWYTQYLFIKKIPFDLDYRQDMSLIVYYGTLSSSKLLL